jgi:hypothetical protein
VLPPWLAVYFTLALCLLARLPYQDALRSLAGDGAAAEDSSAAAIVPAAAAIVPAMPHSIMVRGGTRLSATAVSDAMTASHHAMLEAKCRTLRPRCRG